MIEKWFFVREADDGILFGNAYGPFDNSVDAIGKAKEYALGNETVFLFRSEPSFKVNITVEKSSDAVFS